MQRTCDWVTKATQGQWLGNAANTLLLVDGVCTDTRKIQENQLYVPLIGERFDGHEFVEEAILGGAAAALWQADHPLPEKKEIPLIVVTDTLVALQEMARCYLKEVKPFVVAVTGSNGKTTTKELIASVLSTKYKVHKTEGNLNNHIGVPLTVLSMPESTKIVVIEMGMNHAGEIALLSSIASPDIGIITNIGEAHLQFLGDKEGIASAKLEITKGMKRNGLLLIDGDEPSLLKQKSAIRVGFGPMCDLTPTKVEMKGLQGFTFYTYDSDGNQTPYTCPLIGLHNVKNALFALAVGRDRKLTDEQIAQGLKNVPVMAMRLNMELTPYGFNVLNDAYNASPTSMRAALNVLKELEGPKWVLLGDMEELGDKEQRYHTELGKEVAKLPIDQIYTIGKKGAWIAEGVRLAGKEAQHFVTIEEAVSVLQEKAAVTTATTPPATLLVKASRSLQLDQLVRQLTDEQKGRQDG